MLLKVKNIPSLHLVDELDKPLISRVKKHKVYSSFRDNIWIADLADMELISKYNKRIWLSSCVIDIYSKHACVAPLKNK